MITMCPNRLKTCSNRDADAQEKYFDDDWLDEMLWHNNRNKLSR